MTDALFWYGCNMTRHAEIIRLGTRMLQAVGVGAQPVGGPAACCGSPKESTPRIAEGMANRTMQRFNQSGAAQVITWCPTCHMNLDDFMGATQGKQADSAHLAQVLWDRRQELAPLLTQQVGARVVIDLHMGNGTGVNQAVPGLLRLIPGLEVMDHPYRAPSYMCFGLASIPGALEDARANMLAAMEQTGADTLVTIFHSCHRELVGLERHAGIRVLNWVHLLAESLGWPYQDEYKAWRNSTDPEAAIGAERIAAAGEDAVRRLVLPELRRP
ncbi:MAG: (Fe-S)-binding protein [Rubritepida sp.]|nr:(Fe-S)-binding protein [Rubritepida sp.]